MLTPSSISSSSASALSRHDEHILSWLSQRPLGSLFMNPLQGVKPDRNTTPAPNSTIGARVLSLTPRRGESPVMVKAFEGDDDDVAKYNPLYKTNYCREFTITGRCPFQDKCHFAHGARELRPMPTDSPRSPIALSEHVYKTELCTVFIRDGSCRYGVRCHFAHGLQELRPRSSTKVSRPGKCLQWSASGICRFGDSCRFQHE